MQLTKMSTGRAPVQCKLWWNSELNCKTKLTIQKLLEGATLGCLSHIPLEDVLAVAVPSKVSVIQSSEKISVVKLTP